MIKIPKNFDELKQLVGEVPITDMLDKMKSGINSASEVVKGATKTPNHNESTLMSDLARLQSLNKEQAECLARLSIAIGHLQEQLMAQQVSKSNELDDDQS